MRDNRSIFEAALLIAISVVAINCGSKRDPGRAYMPDMMYSRAFETYDQRDSLKFTMDISNKGGKMIYYDARPVEGTIKRDEQFPYILTNDSIGYKMSAGIKNPFDSISTSDLAESGRLYNINCGICHGDKGKANGPMAGKVGGIIDLTGPQYVALADGTIFHVMTYGKNNMGSYASQLDRKQRWMIVKYVRSLQQPSKAADSTAEVSGVKADSTVLKKG